MDIQRLDMNIRTRSDDIYQHQPENTTLYGCHMIPIEYSYNHIFGEATNVIKSVSVLPRHKVLTRTES